MTKRLVSVLVAFLMVMALIPMSVFAAEATVSKSGNAVVSNAKTAKAFATKDADVVFDFEYSDESEFDWTLVDSDGDGYNWMWLCYGVNYSYESSYEGNGHLSSASYNSSGALNPDNWAITPAIDLADDAATLSFYVGAQDPSYSAEHYAVYVGLEPNIESMNVILPESVATADYVNKTVDISDYAGETVYFAFRHFNVYDMFRINLDLVEIYKEGEEPVAPTEEPTEPPTPPEEGNARVILTVGDVWGDGSGYQMLLDADANAYGTVIPESGALTSSGDASDEVYAEFEYKIPENADGACDTQNIVINDSVELEIPAGTYDWCITNPTPDDRVWISSELGNVGGRQDDYEFEEGKVYEFIVTLNTSAGNDQVNVTITDTNGEPVTSDLDRALNIEGGTLHFETSEDYPWVAFSDGDRLAAWSGNKGVASSTSTVSTVVNALAGDTLSFDFMAWGEGSYTFWDECELIVNGETVANWGAYDNNDWEAYTYTFEEDGEYIVVWSYTKDSSVNPTGDYFAVDNVYVGEPVMPEQIVATESIEVPVNRSEMIEWSVLPENATNKDVTFVCDDTSIATVSDKGVVFGVAEGETFVTITSVADPSVFAVCEVNVVDTGLTCANIYGICTYDFAGVDESTWVTFTDVDPSNTTVIGTEPGAYAAAYAYGNVYGFTTDGDFFKASFEDISNPNVIEGVTDYTITSMTYDYTRGCLIGVAIDDSDNSLLVMADPDSGTIMEIGELETHLFGIAVDENGNGYGIDNYGDLYSVDFDTADITLIGYTDVPCAYVQDICYDFNTGDLYWAQIASLDSHGLYRVNKETAYAEYLGAIGQEGMEIVGMFIIPDEEPEPPENVSVESISVSPDEVEIHVGDTAQFNAIVRPFNASNKNIEWGVDDESIIAVDQNGLVIGLAEGTAMVYATTEDGEYTDYALVNVLPPLGEKVAGYYFEDEVEVTSWQFIDADGDGYNWSSTLLEGITNMTPYEGENIIFSESFSNDAGTALNPDNWAISPAVELNGTSATVTLYAKGQDADYAAEHFAIYAGLTDDPTEMTMLTDELIATGEYVCYEADLSQFVGEEVYIAIRHYNVSDEFILNIDQVEVWCNDSEPTEHIWGDADGDGDVDMNDVLLIMRYVMELDTIAPANLDPWCDVNCDGVVNMTDALLISRYIIDIVPVLPVAGEGE